jgi:hypothetical protein
MIDIVASALTFEHWHSHGVESQSSSLCRTQSTSSTHSEPAGMHNEHTRIFRQNMPHLQFCNPPAASTMRLIESLPNFSIYDA